MFGTSADRPLAGWSGGIVNGVLVHAERVPAEGSDTRLAGRRTGT